MEELEIKGVKLYPLDKDNEIEIEKDGWSVWLSIEEAKDVIDFLQEQVIKFKQE